MVVAGAQPLERVALGVETDMIRGSYASPCRRQGLYGRCYFRAGDAVIAVPAARDAVATVLAPSLAKKRDAARKKGEERKRNPPLPWKTTLGSTWLFQSSMVESAVWWIVILSATGFFIDAVDKAVHD